MGWQKGNKLTTELLSFLSEKNFEVDPQLTGEIIRFDRQGKNNGWFVGKEITTKTGKSAIVACFGDWKLDERHDFLSQGEFNEEENKELRTKLSQAQKKAEKEKQKLQETVAKTSQAIFNQANPTGNSPYSTRKNIGHGFGEKYTPSNFGDDDLLVPLRECDGKIWGFQRISPNGTKYFCEGQRIKGCFHQIGVTTDKFIIAEGFATGASIWLATNITTIIAFNASNLKEVAKEIRQKYPQAQITIACDDDRFSPKNVGIEHGKDAAFAARATYIIPVFKNNTENVTDFNDLHVKEGLGEVKKQFNEHKFEAPSEIIATQNTGFHTITWERGREVKKPNYDDLLQYFDRKHHYQLLETSGMCYVWNKTHYIEYPYLENFAEANFFPKPDMRTRLEFKKKVLASKIVPMFWWDSTTTHKANFQNGVLDLKTMEFSPSSPKLGFRYVLGYDYDPTAKCPTFDKFLREVLNNDQDLMSIVCEFVGYAMSNDEYWLHKALILEGEGSNGKSTLMNVIKALAGKDSYSVASLAGIKKENTLQTLDGKLFNISSETPSKALFESSLFKAITSGEEVNVRKLYSNTYTMKNRAKLILACNDMPETTDYSHGLVRRLMIVPFRQVFSTTNGNKDAFIERKLKLELPGIFNKMIAAYKEVVKREAFTHSKASHEELEIFKSANEDFATSWIKDTLVAHPLGNGHDDKLSPVQSVYTQYSGDSDAGGIKPVDIRSFGKKLARHIPNYKDRLQLRRVKIDGKPIPARVLVAVTRESGESF